VISSVSFQGDFKGPGDWVANASKLPADLVCECLDGEKEGVLLLSPS
jgi:hypothetical protein